MTVSKRRRDASGQSGNARAARNSHTSLSTTSESFETISHAEIAAHAIVLSLLACSPILNPQVGLTETEAARRNIAVRVTKIPMSAVLRTRTIDETHGFMKALIEAKGDRILGFTMLGPEAGEVMAVVEMAMLAEFSYTKLRDAILTHPTMAEGLNALFSRVEQAKAETIAMHSTRAQVS